jgi:hypothetical protein
MSEEDDDPLRSNAPTIDFEMTKGPLKVLNVDVDAKA